MAAQSEVRYSACPHDCPSTCALEVERLGDRLIGKVRGARDNTYTAGVICSKVARYAERIHHPDRLTTPLRRVGDKGSRDSFAPVSWDDALDIVAESLLKAEQRHGSETVWPYYYAGTMGFVMRDGINRLRHVKRYSGQHSTICVTLAWNGFIAGTGRLAGSDPREMAKSDLVVIWGTNAAATQVNVMTHALEARRRRDAPIVVIDTYRNATAKQADLFVCVRPGTDGALACAVMHILFRDGYANREYLARYTDCPGDLERHLADRSPQWAERITGVPVDHHRAACPDDRVHAAHLPPPRIRLLPAAQRRGEHARGAVHRGGDRRVAARGRGRIPQQRRDLSLGQVDDRRARRHRPVDPGLRPVSHRADPGRRQARPRRWPARHRTVHPEHEPDDGRAGAGTGAPGVRPRRSLRLRARAVHDRDRGGRRHRAAGHDVPGARGRVPVPAATSTSSSAPRSSSRRASAVRTTRWCARWRSGWRPSTRGSR